MIDDVKFHLRPWYALRATTSTVITRISWKDPGEHLRQSKGFTGTYRDGSIIQYRGRRAKVYIGIDTGRGKDFIAQRCGNTTQMSDADDPVMPIRTLGIPGSMDVQVPDEVL